MNSPEDSPPIIFISYSHDSAEHKQWVAELAGALVKNGIEVILDQWSLSLGDDIAKFMQNGVVNSDKVLMICTEPYVSKVDDGIGGVGYEALIVTGELIKDLGTSKFIPVVKQSSDSPQLPKSLATRFYVNMSNQDEYDINIESILRELHKAPKLSKPPLGKNPFGLTPSGEDVLGGESEPFLDFSSYPDPGLYSDARIIIGGNDISAWRRLVRSTHIENSGALVNYRGTIEGHSPSTKDGILDMVLNASTTMAPFISLGIAGVESGKKAFRNQRALLDMITRPPNWVGSGASRIVSLPESIAFVYQAIHGATCVFTNQLGLAIDFVLQQSEYRNINKSTQLWKNHLIMGWPHSLDTNSTLTLELLNIVSNKWEWLLDIFGDIEEFKSSLLSYYLMLNTLDFIDLVRQGKEEVLPSDNIRLDIPLNFLVGSEDVSTRAYQYLLENKDPIINHLNMLHIPIEKLYRHWSPWIESCRLMYETWDRHSYRYEFAHGNLFSDLYPNID